MYIALGVCLLLAEQVFAVMWIDLLVMLRKTKLIIIAIAGTPTLKIKLNLL